MASPTRSDTKKDVDGSDDFSSASFTQDSREKSKDSASFVDDLTGWIDDPLGWVEKPFSLKQQFNPLNPLSLIF